MLFSRRWSVLCILFITWVSVWVDVSAFKIPLPTTSEPPLDRNKTNVAASTSPPGRPAPEVASVAQINGTLITPVESLKSRAFGGGESNTDQEQHTRGEVVSAANGSKVITSVRLNESSVSELNDGTDQQRPTGANDAVKCNNTHITDIIPGIKVSTNGPPDVDKPKSSSQIVDQDEGSEDIVTQGRVLERRKRRVATVKTTRIAKNIDDLRKTDVNGEKTRIPRGQKKSKNKQNTGDKFRARPMQRKKVQRKPNKNKIMEDSRKKIVKRRAAKRGRMRPGGNRVQDAQSHVKDDGVRRNRDDYYENSENIDYEQDYIDDADGYNDRADSIDSNDVYDVDDSDGRQREALSDEPVSTRGNRSRSNKPNSIQHDEDTIDYENPQDKGNSDYDDDYYDDYEDIDEIYNDDENDLDSYKEYGNYRRDVTAQGDSGDVTAGSANDKKQFSNRPVGSADVIVHLTNRESGLTKTGHDVGKHQKGVGGKSMNEAVNEIFSKSTPPRILPLDACDMDIGLKVLCAGNAFSACVTGEAGRRVKVTVEDGDGGVLLGDAEQQVMYGVLRSRESRWRLTAAPDPALLRDTCPYCAHHTPVLKLQEDGRVCRYSVNCTLKTNEGYSRLPSSGLHDTPCASSPLVYTRLLLTMGGSPLLPSTAVSLGDKLLLRVEAEADLTGSSLLAKLAPDGSSEGHPGVDLHLQKCWVGNRNEERATLVHNGCSLVDILSNFDEYLEPSTKRHTANNITEPEFPVNKFHRNSNKENSIVTENNNKTADTTVFSTKFTERVIQEASLVAFVLDLADKSIEITCNLKVCVGQCLEVPVCVRSSVNLDTGRAAPPPLFTATHTLTVSFSPTTEETQTEAPEELTNKPLPTNDSSEVIRANFERIRREATDNESGTIIPTTTDISPEFAALVNTNQTATRFATLENEKPVFTIADCVPWWVFILSISVLSLVYVVALVGCVYVSNQVHRSRSSDVEVIHTPARPFYASDSSARKRSPAIYPESFGY